MKNTKIIYCIGFLLSLVLLCASGCQKWIELDTVQNKTQAEVVFSDAPNSNLAINGIYRMAKDNFPAAISNYAGLASDELMTLSGIVRLEVYMRNQIPPDNGDNPWASFYKVIYACNAAIEGLNANSSINETPKKQYLAEAKFNRALCYFYLVNLYGDVPLVTTTTVSINATISRSQVSAVYELIQNDLNEAIPNLQVDYTFTGIGRIRANKWSAVALLAKVNLYLKDYKAAETNTTMVINSGLYSLLNSPVGIFSNDNTEAILQWANAPTEGNLLASNITQNPPNIVVTQKLLNSFEPNDLRRIEWIKTKTVSGVIYNYPFKFTTAANGANERYTILRLGEQYLIRAEARAMQNNFEGAIADVNLIRLKHGGLNIPLTVPTDQEKSLDVIQHERYVELFYEGAHRWFDLKRTQKINAIMNLQKPNTWKATAALYPIPQSDIQNNPNLKQNPGYN